MTVPEPTTLFDAAFRRGDRAMLLVRGERHAIVAANARCADLLGVAPLDVEGAPIASMPVWRDPAQVAEMCGRAISTGAITSALVMMDRVASADPSPARVELAAVPLGFADAALVWMDDATEPDRLTEMRGRGHRLEEMGRLAGGIAHDFNNLLSVVQAYAQIVLASVEQRGSAEREDVQEIIHAVARGRELTAHLLAFTRNRPIERRLVDVNAGLRALAGMLRPLLGPDIVLGQYLAAGIPPILADQVQLDQVIMNLAINACDAMPAGGHLSIATRHIHVAPDELPVDPDMTTPGDYVLIEIADTGHGIDATTRQRIFEPFFTTRAAEAGTGLGLAVVAGIVRQSGGTIAVRSVVGRGTTFRLFWPVAPPIDEQPVRFARGSAAATCVMVIQHDPSVRQMIRRLLGEHGFDSAQARDEHEAMHMLTSRWAPGSGPALVLADVGDPAMDGAALATLLSRRRPDLPLVLMSSCTEQAASIESLSNVPVPVLSVPFDNAMLVERVRRALVAWEAQRPAT